MNITRRKATASALPPGLDPDGAHPVKQERSRQLRDRALTVARTLVEEGRFATTTMAEMARAVGCSAGALYFRFHDKDALFASVVQVAMAREVERLVAQAAAGRYRELPLRETVAACVQDFVTFTQGNDAMIRALYQRTGEDPGSWSVVRSAALQMTDLWIDAVVQAAGHGGDRAYMRQTGIAFQFVSSSLVYSVLIDQPVRPLSRRELEFWLVEMVMHFIALDVPAPLRGTPVVRGDAAKTAQAADAPARRRAARKPAPRKVAAA